MTNNEYLNWILNKYQAKDLNLYAGKIFDLNNLLRDRAGTCFSSILNSGSRAKWTAIHLASDVDYMISLKSGCNENNGWLKSIYDWLYSFLSHRYITRKQNVSFRILLTDLEVDITPARKHSGNTNNHWLYVSKKDTWQQTNIQKHISDISQSWRTNEIKLLKIWRELNWLDFPSIYMEYLLISLILCGKRTDISYLSENFLFILNELAKDYSNPLYSRIVDPANSCNILSDLLSESEKKAIIYKAKASIAKQYWQDIVR